MARTATDPKIAKAHCPECGGERNAYIRAEYTVNWADTSEPISSADTGMVLECCGCNRVFFRRDYWFSEWETVGQNPYTGELEMQGGTETTYWPVPVKRKPPEWVDELQRDDPILGRLLSEMYVAFNNDLSVLAAIGARTAFDRSSELLGVPPELPFGQKLDQLVTLGKVSGDEKATLSVLVDAGSAAAHRGWTPKSEELSTMVDLVESFLHRSFVLGDGIKKLEASVPKRMHRTKRAK